MDRRRENFLFTALIFIAFVIFTVLVMKVDVKPVGPNSSKIGFATINMKVFSAFGISKFWYIITQILGYICLFVLFMFVALGFHELKIKKDISKVDKDLVILVGIYFLMFLFYIFFEKFIVNYRPMVVENELKASYPSSHSLLAVCVMSTAAYEFKTRIKNIKTRKIMVISSILIMILTVIGRLLSGRHYLTDIIGAILLGAFLFMLFYSLNQNQRQP